MVVLENTRCANNISLEIFVTFYLIFFYSYRYKRFFYLTCVDSVRPISIKYPDWPWANVRAAVPRYDSIILCWLVNTHPFCHDKLFDRVKWSKWKWATQLRLIITTFNSALKLCKFSWIVTELLSILSLWYSLNSLYWRVGDIFLISV